MIGMEDSSSGGLQGGGIAQCIILSVGPSAPGMEHWKQMQEHELKKAAALGMQPVDVPYNAKNYGLAVEYAVVSVGDEKIITGYGDQIKLPNYPHTGKINQLALTQVFARSLELWNNGKEFGYNFQKQGGGDTLNSAKSPNIVNLHPNPNIEKDWDSGVSAKTVPVGQEEKYSDLLNKEAERLNKWNKVCEQWQDLSEQDAEDQLLQGLSRRMLLYTKTDKRIFYVAPKPGMMFQAKISKREGSKYFDLVFFEYDKVNKKYNFLVDLEKDCSFAFDEETIELAEQIKKANDIAREAYKARQASATPSVSTSNDDEWE